MKARSIPVLLACVLLASVGLLAGRPQQTPQAGSTEQAGSTAQAASTAPTDLRSAIARLGSLDYPTRMNAARLVRRAPQTEAVAALTSAVRESSDQFVRYRALVILTGFADAKTPELMRTASTDRNDRLREVAYRWMAARPQPSTAPALLSALQTEQAEFVRPALVRALAALGQDREVQRVLVGEVARGQDFFRIGVIDALGEFKSAYAFDAIAAVARTDGPLQDDAVLALGRIGERRAESVLAMLSSVTPETTTAVQAAYCLLGSDCEVRIKAIADAMLASGSRPEVSRGAAAALTVLAASGSAAALSTLADLSMGSRVQQLATISLGGAALRDPATVLSWLTRLPASQQAGVVAAMRSAFERFEEDFSEEQFFAAARAAYWRAPEGSADRALMATLIQELEF